VVVEARALRAALVRFGRRRLAATTGITLVASTSALILLVEWYQSQSTKSPELIFSALVGDDGARDVRFERAFRT
jgi:hypothetical protein